MDRINENIIQANCRNLKTVLFIITLLDYGFYVFARIDNTYPSNPDLLFLMLFNAIANTVLFLSIFFFYKKFPKIMGLAIPMITLGLKIMFNFVMDFDVMVVFYFIAIFLILNTSVKTKYEMIIVSIFYEIILFYQWVNGSMVNIAEPYALVIINGVVTITSSIVGMYRYKQYVQIVKYQYELIESKKTIEKYMSLRDLSIDFNHKLLEHTSARSYLKYIINGITGYIDNVDAAAVFLVEDNTLKLISSMNYILPKDREFHLDVFDSFSYKYGIIDSVNPSVLNDLDKMEYERYEAILPCIDGKKIKSSLSTPLTKNGKLFGLLNLDSSKNDVFTKSDIAILTYFGEQISIALENFTLYSDIRRLSEYDQLTGFRNRWYLNDIKNVYVKNWRDENQNVQIGLFDLDGLKSINDKYGHSVGDEYIVAFCDGLRNSFSEIDMFIRNGGDEFIGVFIDTSEKEIVEKLENLRKRLSISSLGHDMKKIHVYFSYGVVNLSDYNYDLYKVLNLADVKMYKYKNSNRGKI